MKMNARQFAAYAATREQRLITELTAAEQANIADAKAEAIIASSGTHSQAELTAAGHPYARRAPQTAAYPPGIINKQKGDFAAGWETTPSLVRGRTIVTQCVNVDPVKHFLNGTPKMVARPINAVVMERIKQRRIARLRAAVRKAMSK